MRRTGLNFLVVCWISGLTKQADILIESNSRSLHKRRTTRAAAASKQRLWPNDTIPYFLDPVLSSMVQPVFLSD